MTMLFVRGNSGDFEKRYFFFGKPFVLVLVGSAIDYHLLWACGCALHPYKAAILLFNS
jgi:hypothetical protein